MEKEKISVTPQMLRTAVKELQKRELFVKLKSLKTHIQRHYPVERDFKVLEKELQEKLEYAVYVGLLAKHGDDQYFIPTLRQEANTVKTAISAFWKMYKNNNRLRNVRKKKADVKRSVSRRKQKDHMSSSNTDETGSSEDLDYF
ncbi:uncharacterized protein LOC114932998 [Nylanderia fulva]|uniref:uncharacterized protein LOC114932998 n=1 Tax=Nylanderia fulva TaxID=613905 RepID=UPI0010FB26C9|nr:uncharacterized protein LOC114932998 [Nylanderia fulva]